jgi:tetratricopeptide (TPR) repeat protein
MLIALLVVCSGALTASSGRQGPDDPQLRAAVERFFATQESEDIDAYLALWSTKSERPQRDQLKFVFDSGDDKYSNITIVRAMPAGDRVRVRVTATRDRSAPLRSPDEPPRVLHSTSEWSLSYVREDGEWKLEKQGTAIDGLAAAVIEAATPADREALLAAESDLVDDLLVTALARQATQAAQSNRYAAAQVGFERMRDIAQRIKDRKSEGDALQNIANTMYFQRNYQSALEAYEAMLVIVRERNDDEGIAAALQGVAIVRYSFAEYGVAWSAYREALTIFERLQDQGAISRTLVNTGNVLYVQGDFSSAIADFTRSREISRSAKNAAGEANALEGLGRVFLAQGDYAAALEAFTGVLAERRTRNDRNQQGAVLMNIGDAHFRLGNLESARRALDDARTHFEATKDPSNVGRAWLALALTDLVASRFQMAEDEYRKSMSSCTAAGNQECVASATVGLAFAQTQQDKFQEGIASYRKGIEAFTALKRREQAARAEVGLSQALAAATQYTAALDAATHAASEAEAITNDDVLWRARVAEAVALRNGKERPRAIKATEAAIAAVDRLKDAAAVRPSAPVPRDSASAFAILALLQAEDGDAAAAFESIERMRVHDLRAILAPSEREVSRGMTEAERDEERALAVELVSLHAQLQRERTLPKPDAARIARLEASVADATQRRAVQQQRLFERLPTLRVWRGLMPPATRADVADLLSDRSTVLVEIVVTDEATLTVVAKRGAEAVEFTSHVEPSRRKVIAERVAGLTQPAVFQDEKAWRRATSELIPGLSATFGHASRAIVIPHGVLWRVPFEALPVEDGYLADSMSITYAPSVTALVRAPRSASSDPANAVADFVIVGSPQLSPATIERTAQTAPGWLVRPLASSDQEMKALGTEAAEHTIRIDGADATEAALRERLPGARVIHLATPFRINGASPLFSSTLLAPDASHDAALEAREIMNLDLHARVAVVSDGSAMSMRDAADEVATLAWTWRAAGVPTLMLRRWASDDALSSTCLADLHARLRAGDAPDVALQAARKNLRGRKGGALPFQWAAWMVIAQE